MSGPPDVVLVQYTLETSQAIIVFPVALQGTHITVMLCQESAKTTDDSCVIASRSTHSTLLASDRSLSSRPTFELQITNITVVLCQGSAKTTGDSDVSASTRSTHSTEGHDSTPLISDHILSNRPLFDVVGYIYSFFLWGRGKKKGLPWMKRIWLLIALQNLKIAHRVKGQII